MPIKLVGTGARYPPPYQLSGYLIVMHLPPPQPPAEPSAATMAVREDVWGRPIFRAPALTVFTSPELLHPRGPVFPVRRFRANAARKKKN